MEPNMLRDGEKIKVPAAWATARNEEAQRRRSVEEWKGYLGDQQAKALDEEGPFGGFRTKIPLGKLRAFNPDEQDELMSAEKAEYERLRPVAVARAEQRRAFVAAGGSTADFDALWENGGREMHIAQAADENLNRASRSSEIY